MSSSSSPPPSLLSKSLASASSLVLLQLFSRLFTFALNQALVRLVSPQVFGTASIQFELLLSTILFLSREGVRNALLRAKTPSGDHDKKKDAPGAEDTLIANISLLPVLLGIPTTILTTFLYIRNSSSETSSQPHFHLSVVIYALSALLELLSEPLYIRAQNELRFDVRVKAEGKAVVAKTAATFLGLVLAGEDWALAAFAGGQAIYAAVLCGEFVRVYAGKGMQWIIKKVRVKVHGKCVFFVASHMRIRLTLAGVARKPSTLTPRYCIFQVP